jgi:hypothetical protein
MFLSSEAIVQKAMKIPYFNGIMLCMLMIGNAQMSASCTPIPAWVRFFDMRDV